MKQQQVNDPKRKTILLINPHHNPEWVYGESTFSVPIGLLYIATYLENAGYKPVIIDTCADPGYEAVIDRFLPETLYVGLSVMTPQVPHAYAVAKHIRKKQPDIPIIWGGIHPSLYPDSCRDTLCDVAVLGEGEETAVELADVLSSGGSLKNIAGIAYQDNEHTVTTPPRKLVDMDQLPRINYQLMNIEKYVRTYIIQEKRMARVLPIHAARGCPWRCTFCINTTLNAERRYRPRSAKDIIEEIKELREPLNLEGIMLQDEEFFAHRGRVLAFLDEIEKNRLQSLRFYATCRINHFRQGYIDRNFLHRLKECGFVDLVFGFESGSRNCLEIIQKEITVDQGLYAARLLAETGFQVVWGFIMAIPGEKRDDLMKTIRVMEKLRRLSRDFYFIGPQVFRPYPGSILYQEALRYGLKEPDTLEEWSRISFSDEGWVSAEDLPWLDPKDHNLIDYINFIAPIYFNRDYIGESGLKKILHGFLRLVFRLRMATNRWGFPVEHKAHKSLKSLYDKLLKLS